MFEPGDSLPTPMTPNRATGQKILAGRHRFTAELPCELKTTEFLFVSFCPCRSSCAGAAIKPAGSTFGFRYSPNGFFFFFPGHHFNGELACRLRLAQKQNPAGEHGDTSFKPVQRRMRQFFFLSFFQPNWTGILPAFRATVTSYQSCVAATRNLSGR